MIYVDYAYYTDTYCGSLITEQLWPTVAQEASAYMDIITYGRLKHGVPVSDNVKMATCAVAEEIYKYIVASEAKNSGINSENTDGYSVTYDNAEVTAKQYNNAKLQAADRYLLRSDPLRYAGVC